MPGETGPRKDTSCEISVTVTYHIDRRPGAVGTVPARGKPSMVSYTKEFLHAHRLRPYGLLYHRTTDWVTSKQQEVISHSFESSSPRSGCQHGPVDPVLGCRFFIGSSQGRRG